MASPLPQRLQVAPTPQDRGRVFNIGSHPQRAPTPTGRSTSATRRMESRTRQHHATSITSSQHMTPAALAAGNYYRRIGSAASSVTNTDTAVADHIINDESPTPNGGGDDDLDDSQQLRYRSGSSLSKYPTSIHHRDYAEEFAIHQEGEASASAAAFGQSPPQLSGTMTPQDLHAALQREEPHGPSGTSGHGHDEDMDNSIVNASTATEYTRHSQRYRLRQSPRKSKKEEVVEKKERSKIDEVMSRNGKAAWNRSTKPTSGSNNTSVQHSKEALSKFMNSGSEQHTTSPSKLPRPKAGQVPTPRSRSPAPSGPSSRSNSAIATTATATNQHPDRRQTPPVRSATPPGRQRTGGLKKTNATVGNTSSIVGQNTANNSSAASLASAAAQQVLNKLDASQPGGVGATAGTTNARSMPVRGGSTAPSIATSDSQIPTAATNLTTSHQQQHMHFVGHHQCCKFNREDIVEVVMLRSQLEAVKTHLEAAERQVVAQESVILEHRQEVKAKDNTIAELEESMKLLDSVKMELESEQGYNDRLMEKVEEKVGRINALEDELSRARTLIRQLEEDVHDQRHGSSVLESQLKQIMEENISLKSSEELWKAKVSELQNREAGVQQHQLQSDGELERLRDEVENYKAIRGEMIAALAEKEKKCAMLEQQLTMVSVQKLGLGGGGMGSSPAAVADRSPML